MTETRSAERMVMGRDLNFLERRSRAEAESAIKQMVAGYFKTLVVTTLL